MQRCSQEADSASPGRAKCIHCNTHLEPSWRATWLTATREKFAMCPCNSMVILMSEPCSLSAEKTIARYGEEGTGGWARGRARRCNQTVAPLPPCPLQNNTRCYLRHSRGLITRSFTSMFSNMSMAWRLPHRNTRTQAHCGT